MCGSGKMREVTGTVTTQFVAAAWKKPAGGESQRQPSQPVVDLTQWT